MLCAQFRQTIIYEKMPGSIKIKVAVALNLCLKLMRCENYK